MGPALSIPFCLDGACAVVMVERKLAAQHQAGPKNDIKQES
jgi:hypothetical protein